MVTGLLTANGGIRTNLPNADFLGSDSNGNLIASRFTYANLSAVGSVTITQTFVPNVFGDFNVSGTIRTSVLKLLSVSTDFDLIRVSSDGSLVPDNAAAVRTANKIVKYDGSGSLDTVSLTASSTVLATTYKISGLSGTAFDYLGVDATGTVTKKNAFSAPTPSALIKYDSTSAVNANSFVSTPPSGTYGLKSTFSTNTATPTNSSVPAGILISNNVGGSNSMTAIDFATFTVSGNPAVRTRMVVKDDGNCGGNIDFIVSTGCSGPSLGSAMTISSSRKVTISGNSMPQTACATSQILTASSSGTLSCSTTVGGNTLPSLQCAAGQVLTASSAGTLSCGTSVGGNTLPSSQCAVGQILSASSSGTLSCTTKVGGTSLPTTTGGASQSNVTSVREPITPHLQFLLSELLCEQVSGLFRGTDPFKFELMSINQ